MFGIEDACPQVTNLRESFRRRENGEVSRVDIAQLIPAQRHRNGGFRHRSRPIFSVQYHPEASPGPHDATYLFDCFVELMRTRQPIDAESMRRAQSAPPMVTAG